MQNNTGLYVHKYGGTSVGSIERIQAVAKRVADAYHQRQRLVIVVSAMAGETDRLLHLAREIQPQPRRRELDLMLATGEQVTAALVAMALENHGISACGLTGAQVSIVTNSEYGKARIRHIDPDRIHALLDQGCVVVVAGFQGIDSDGNITTLGRGGSDTSAVALAAALGAEECRIYTDVDGVYTTDPRVVGNARLIPRLTFEEMLELASMGSKVLQHRSVECASKYNVCLRVLSSFHDGSGTLIGGKEINMETAVISGIAFNKDEAQLTIIGVPDRPGVAYRILAAVADANIEVDMIVQNIAHDGTTDLTFTVHRNDYDYALEILHNSAQQTGARHVFGDREITKVSVVGVGMRSHAGVASCMFSALADEGINIRMISTSEIKISVVIDEKYMELAVRTLHSAFHLEDDRSV